MCFHGDESSMRTPLCDRATLPHFDRADPALRPLGMGGRGSESNSSTSSFLPEGILLGGRVARSSGERVARSIGGSLMDDCQTARRDSAICWERTWEN